MRTSENAEKQRSVCAKDLHINDKEHVKNEWMGKERMNLIKRSSFFVFFNQIFFKLCYFFCNFADIFEIAYKIDKQQ